MLPVICLKTRVKIIEVVEQSVKGVSVLDAKVMQKLTGILNHSETTETKEKNPPTPTESGDMQTRMKNAGLTDREREIASLIAEGCTNSQIASLLFISEGTVKNYVSVIYDKFDIRDRAKLVLFLRGQTP